MFKAPISEAAVVSCGLSVLKKPTNQMISKPTESFHHYLTQAVRLQAFTHLLFWGCRCKVPMGHSCSASKQRVLEDLGVTMEMESSKLCELAWETAELKI